MVELGPVRLVIEKWSTPEQTSTHIEQGVLDDSFSWNSLYRLPGAGVSLVFGSAAVMFSTAIYAADNCTPATCTPTGPDCQQCQKAFEDAAANEKPRSRQLYSEWLCRSDGARSHRFGVRSAQSGSRLRRHRLRWCRWLRKLDATRFLHRCVREQHAQVQRLPTRWLDAVRLPEPSGRGVHR